MGGQFLIVFFLSFFFNSHFLKKKEGERKTELTLLCVLEEKGKNKTKPCTRPLATLPQDGRTVSGASQAGAS